MPTLVRYEVEGFVVVAHIYRNVIAVLVVHTIAVGAYALFALADNRLERIACVIKNHGANIIAFHFVSLSGLPSSAPSGHSRRTPLRAFRLSVEVLPFPFCHLFAGHFVFLLVLWLSVWYTEFVNFSFLLL